MKTKTEFTLKIKIRYDGKTYADKPITVTNKKKGKKIKAYDPASKKYETLFTTNKTYKKIIVYGGKFKRKVV